MAHLVRRSNESTPGLVGVTVHWRLLREGDDTVLGFDRKKIRRSSHRLGGKANPAKSRWLVSSDDPS
jgi:hypothetical protein